MCSLLHWARKCKCTLVNLPLYPTHTFGINSAACQLVSEHVHVAHASLCCPVHMHCTATSQQQGDAAWAVGLWCLVRTSHLVACSAVRWACWSASANACSTPHLVSRCVAQAVQDAAAARPFPYAPLVHSAAHPAEHLKALPAGLSTAAHLQLAVPVVAAASTALGAVMHSNEVLSSSHCHSSELCLHKTLLHTCQCSSEQQPQPLLETVLA